MVMDWWKRPREKPIEPTQGEAVQAFGVVTGPSGAEVYDLHQKRKVCLEGDPLTVLVTLARMNPEALLAVESNDLAKDVAGVHENVRRFVSFPKVAGIQVDSKTKRPHQRSHFFDAARYAKNLSTALAKAVASIRGHEQTFYGHEPSMIWGTLS